jgi:hypothetical protein
MAAVELYGREPKRWRFQVLALLAEIFVARHTFRSNFLSIHPLAAVFDCD